MLSENMQRALRREREIDYWRLVNMKAEHAEVNRRITVLQLKCEAWRRILPAEEEPDAE